MPETHSLPESPPPQTLQQLQARESHLLSMLNLARDAVVAMDSEGLVTDWNPAAERMLGYSRAQAVGARLSELIIPHTHRAAHEAGFARYLASRRPTIMNRLIEIEALHSSGSLIAVELAIWCFPSGESLGFGAFIRDSSERRALQETLRNTLAEREAILNNALVGIVFSRNRHHEWVNDKFAEMVGYSRDELIGQPSSLVHISLAHWQQVAPATRTALMTVGLYNAERQLKRKNGELFWAQLAGRCVKPLDPDSGVIWTFLDITERKQAEQEIRDALEGQKQLNALRSRFVAMTSHEFRTPLTSILSSTELIKYYGDHIPPDEKAEIIQSIEDGVQRMTRMLDRVLLLGQADAQMLEFRPQQIDLAELCRSLADDARCQLQGTHCRLETGFADNLGTGRFDEKLLRHIFGNLLSNAIKYSPDGGTVRFAVTQDAGETVFTVSDEGIGIPADEIGHLFESFHRASNVGTIAGTGLGLAIVKQAVDLHGGSIAVQSEAGRGSSFRVVLGGGPP